MATSAPAFTLPDYNATLEQRQAALIRLNSIELTVEQYEGGVTAFRSGGLAALEDFCAFERLLPADVAAKAILLRREPIAEALAGCIDLKTDDPERYARYITGPIDPILLGLFADGGMIEYEPDDEGLPY
jgi:hypothetical protein